MPYYAKSLPACRSWGRRAPSSALARSRSFKAGRSGGFSEHFLFGGRAWFTYSISWRLLGLGYGIRWYIKESILGTGSHVQLGLGCSDGTYLEGTSRSCMWPRALACGGGTALVSAGAGGTVRGVVADILVQIWDPGAQVVFCGGTASAEMALREDLAPDHDCAVVLSSAGPRPQSFSWSQWSMSLRIPILSSSFTTLSCPKPKRPRRCSCWRGWRHKPGKKSGLEVSHGPSMARTISYSAKWSCVLCKLGGYSKIVGNMYNQFCKLSIVKCVKWLQWARWSSTVKKTWQTNHKAPKEPIPKETIFGGCFFRGVPWIKRFTDCYRY